MNILLRVVFTFILLIICFYLLVVQDISFLFFGMENFDLFQTEQTFYDFHRNFHFENFLPKWNLFHDLTAYPYGNSHALQSWMIEMNLFYTFCKYLFNTSLGYAQIYYIISITISTFGSFFLLRNTFGDKKSFIFPIFVIFLNFYAINKYPGHFYYSVFHWATLSLCCDFIILKRTFASSVISARLILLKICFLCLTSGLDIGYIFSFSITLTVCMITSVFMFYIYKKQNILVQTALLINNFKRTFNTHIGFNISILLILVSTLYLYGSLFVQLLNAVRLTGSAINGGLMPNINPLRIFLPYFSSFNPVNFNVLFNEKVYPEGVGEGSLGWFVLLITIWAGSKLQKDHWVLLTPYLLLIFLCYIHAAPPFYKSFLKILPWHFYTRVPGRFTIFLPMIAGLICLLAPIRLQNVNKFFILLCTIIGLSEVYSFYSWRYTQTPVTPSKAFLSYMNFVKQQPGEAVLDFPFCVTGGNAIGSNDGLCPVHKANSHIYALQVYHEKKVIGKYNGRLNESQIQPFIEANWPDLLSISKKNDKNGQISTCLDEKKMDFLLSFFKANDFAGMNLYVDLLPDGCATKFYDVFGQPTNKTVVPSAGNVVFIPKKPEWQKFENKEIGKKMTYKCNCK